MTQITIGKNSNGFYINVSGHNTSGRLCTAVSALIAALDGFLQNNFNKDYSFSANEEIGECHIKAPQKAQAAIEMFTIGILRLEKMYPENIKSDINI